MMVAEFDCQSTVAFNGGWKLETSSDGQWLLVTTSKEMATVLITWQQKVLPFPIVWEHMHLPHKNESERMLSKNVG
ncbi:hypothetical protein L195_g013938 [Trifolium pratense]|uniref:Uncharacterized protein n=1 Tax=Trifolium pratense TaxID=57577 RepID=A0A2K3PPI9_TRIPR|nr:hypothetical protein L195_g013938 [Trifolium pratense]